MSLFGKIATAVAPSIVSGLFGKSASDDANDIAEQNVQLQREFAQKGIQWKVKDAQAAGIHPLYALGAQTHQFTPTSVFTGGEWKRDLGQNLGNAIQGLLSDTQRQIEQSTIEANKASAEKDLAISQYYSSEAALNNQRMNSAIPIPYQPTGDQNLTIQPINDHFGAWARKPDQVISGRINGPHIGAGSHPFYREYQIGPQQFAILPYSDEGPAETLQSMPVGIYPMVLKANQEYYGENWNSGFLDSYYYYLNKPLQSIYDAYDKFHQWAIDRQKEKRYQQR